MAKTVSINMQVDPEQQDLLTMAAAALNKSRTAFILDVACQEAKNVLLDWQIFPHGQAQVDTFEEAHEALVLGNSKLIKLLMEPAPWE